MATTYEFEPADKFSSKWKKTSTGNLVAKFADCSPEIQRLLFKGHNANGDTEGFHFSRRISEEYGDNVFRSTTEEHERFMQEKGWTKRSKATTPSQVQAKIDNMPESEYRSLIGKPTDRMLEAAPGADWTPPQLISIALRTLDDESGWNTVRDNKEAGWKAVTITPIENYFVVLMKR
jgi:hypothetical protein